MATLAETLTIKVSADVRDVKKGMDEASRATKRATDSMKKDTDRVVDQLDKMRSEWEKIRGVALFAAAGVAAVVVPTIKMANAMSKAEAAALKTGESVATVRKQSEALGNTLGRSTAASLQTVTKLSSEYGLSMSSAAELTEDAVKLSKAAFISEEQAAASLAAVLERFRDASASAVAEDLNKSTITARSNVGDLAKALAAAGDATRGLNVDYESVLATIVGLRSQGQDYADILSAIAGVSEALRNPASEQASALKEIGIGYDAAAAAGSGFSTIVSELMSAAASNQNVAETVFGNMGTSFTGFQQTVVGGVPAIVEALKKLEAESHTVADAFAAHLDSPIGKWEQFTAKVKDFAGARGLEAIAFPENVSALGTEYAKAVASELGPSIALEFQKNPIKVALDVIFDNSFVRTLLGTGTPEVQGNNQGGLIEKYAGGGKVGGTGASDSVLAKLTPGEFVIKKHVAQAVMPFLQQLNSGGISPSALHNTFLAGLRVKGTPLLELLGIQRDSRLGGGPSGLLQESNTMELLSVASSIRGAIESLQFNQGGAVPRYATGGEVHGGGSTTVNFNVTTHAFNESFVKRSILPHIERTLDRGQSRRRRSGR